MYKSINVNLYMWKFQLEVYAFLAHFSSIWKKMRVLWALVLSVRLSVSIATFYNSRMVHRSLVGLFTLDQGAPEDDFKLLGFWIGLRDWAPGVKKGSKGLKTVKNQFLNNFKVKSKPD